MEDERCVGMTMQQPRLAQALCPAQDGVDEARGVGGAAGLGQLDRLVDGGVVGRGVGEEELVEAESQGSQHRRVEQAGRALGEAFDRDVAGAAALDGGVGEALRLGAVAAAEAEAVRLGAEDALGEGVVLKGGANRREGEGARRGVAV